MRKEIAAAALGLAVARLAWAAPTGGPAAGTDEPADVTAVRPHLRALGDGKKHFLVVEGETLDDEHYYWGDGTRFWALRIGGGGGEKDAKDHWRKKDVVFWEPRVGPRYQASIAFDGAKWQVQCEHRKTEFTPLADAESQALVAAAKFFRPRWRWQAYALARDDRGRYYYVDHGRDPAESKRFRLFVGEKGNLKAMKMTNVVSDSEGDIFSTKTGSLRLILNKQELTWVAGKTRLRLTNVPVDDNHVMIYTDLGVYAGEPLGTPCDEL
jgi:hypothetical protein